MEPGTHSLARLALQHQLVLGTYHSAQHCIAMQLSGLTLVGLTSQLKGVDEKIVQDAATH